MQVSLIATQLHLAMGVSLSCVSDLRRLYDLKLDGTEPIDFRSIMRGPLMGHCVAAKITAHDPSNQFQPSFGKIDQIQHSNHPGAHCGQANNGFKMISGILCQGLSKSRGHYGHLQHGC
jgi:biotin carboxylase